MPKQRNFKNNSEAFLKLDAGCGAYPKGDVNLDFSVDKSPHRENKIINIQRTRNFILGDINRLPFRSKAFASSSRTISSCVGFIFANACLVFAKSIWMPSGCVIVSSGSELTSFLNCSKRVCFSDSNLLVTKSGFFTLSAIRPFFVRLHFPSLSFM